MSAIEKVLKIAKNEVGYLEKASNSNLYDKKTNAGSANYTKYWADLYPSYQGQPWCAIFVTWCFVQAFGKDMTKTLLKHYPFTYCPTLGGLFTLNANPKVGDIVLFYSNGRFSHTGLVTGVKEDYFTTVEGNTSADAGIIANGGGVSEKGYYNSKLAGTKFVTVDWSLVQEEEIIETAIELEGYPTVAALNIRTEPSTDGSILGVCHEGDRLEVTAQTSNNWYKVKIDDSTSGYVSGKYFTIEPKEELTEEEFAVLFNNYLEELCSQDRSEWAVPATTFCESKNIFQGDENGNKKYRDYLTREQLSEVIFNIFKEV